jgi:hypothetical protein
MTFKEAVIEVLKELPGDEAYGFNVVERVAQLTGNRLSIYWFYIQMDNLEEEGLVGHYDMPGGPERNSMPKRCWYLRNQ